MKNGYDNTGLSKPKSSIKNSAVGYISNLIEGNSRSAAGSGLEAGLSALTKTALRRLPVPLNFVAPIIVEKVIIRYGIENGRELLIKGLKWVKKATDEKPSGVIGPSYQA